MCSPIAKKVWYLLLWISLSCGSKNSTPISTYQVTEGEFVINVVETGELKATRSIMISAPAISWNFGDLKITKLIDDGTAVQQGDTLVEFDQAEVQKAIIDANAELEIAKADYAKNEANQNSKIEDLEADLKMAEISFEVSKLELEQAFYESDIRKKEIQLQLDQAEISLNKARNEIENQKQVHREELRKLKLKIDQLELNLKDAHDTLRKLTVTAPNNGLVIIEENWMSDTKWQVSDQPFSGWPLMSLPDLSEIKAEAQINEVDISKIKLNQPVRLKLDASPDTTFTGKVVMVATLAKEKDRKSKVKVFPIEILIDGIHKLLMPGMTVSCEIVVDKIPKAIFIPIEGFFKKDEKNIVYIARGTSYKPREIKIGVANNDFIVIEQGLKPGETIALGDPSQASATSKTEKKKGA
ncbi:efflux RND transporter periplasmic adaptor subunit [candidate division KSB1 bacterium]|nr:efflux RND transporter periplasmic adaptor subunit [candidate division KSB1 bacterium]